MNINTIIIRHKKVCNLIVEKKVRQAFDIMSDMLDNVTSGELRDEFGELEMTYRNILKYTVEGVRDPEREKIYNKLLQRILRLNDRLKQDILAHYSGWNIYSVRRREQLAERLRGGNIIQSVDDLVFKRRLDDLLTSSDIEAGSSLKESAEEAHRLSDVIFNHLWLTDYYGEAEETLMSMLIGSNRFPWYDTASFISAITLSNLRVWDPSKVRLLAEMINEKKPQLAERAITGLIFSLYFYSDRVKLYPDLLRMIKDLGADPGFREKCRIVVLQAVRSRYTDKLSRRMTEEILPKVVRLRPRIDEKLDLDKILGDNPEEGENPDWSSVFSGSEELFRTMEELTNLQMEGSDVYMTAFSGLKNFDFFREMRNWFIPFYPDHQAVDAIYRDEILGPAINELAEALYNTPFICNSDKFSLILNMKYLPAEQKNMMLSVFKMELEGLQQLKYENQITDPAAGFRTTVTQYVQDLYRFFKLSDFRNEFDDLFTGRLDIYNALFYRQACSSENDDRSLADYFFSKEYYEDALSLYLTLLDKNSDDAEIYEKAGFCYQKENNYEKALDKYTRAVIIEPKRWTLQKAGFCLRKLGRPAEALDYYLRALQHDPDDLNTILMTAHCYLDTGNFEEALRHYFRIEYESPGNSKVLRPIAWCYLVTGRYSEAGKYFKRLSAAGLTAFDRINLGHLALCEGEMHQAAQHYIDAITIGQMEPETFRSVFNDDMAVLTANGVNQDDLPILLDYVLMNTVKSD